MTTRFAYRHAASSGHAGDFIATRGGDPRPAVNSLGFRERQVGPKDPNRYRIAVIGDSFSWGQGLEERERFSNLLDQRLSPGAEVLNFGLPGHTMPEHLDELSPVLRLGADFVLLQLYINNFETPDMRRPSAYPLLPQDLTHAPPSRRSSINCWPIAGRNCRSSASSRATSITSRAISAIRIAGLPGGLRPTP